MNQHNFKIEVFYLNFSYYPQYQGQELNFNYFFYQISYSVPKFWYQIKKESSKKKNFYERRSYESVDDGSISQVSSQKEIKKIIKKNHLSSVHVAAIKTTYLIKSVYSKLPLSWTLTQIELKF